MVPAMLVMVVLDTAIEKVILMVMVVLDTAMEKIILRDIMEGMVIMVAYIMS